MGVLRREVPPLPEQVQRQIRESIAVEMAEVTCTTTVGTGDSETASNLVTTAVENPSGDVAEHLGDPGSDVSRLTTLEAKAMDGDGGM